MRGSHMTMGIPIPFMVPMVSIMLRMMGMSDSFDHSVETAVGSCDIFDHSGSAVCFFERIRPPHMMPVSVFVLLLYVAGMGVVDRIFEFIFDWPLEEEVVSLLKFKMKDLVPEYIS